MGKTIVTNNKSVKPSLANTFVHRELETFFNETQFVEFDKFRSGKLETDFGQVIVYCKVSVDTPFRRYATVAMQGAMDCIAACCGIS